MPRSALSCRDPVNAQRGYARDLSAMPMRGLPLRATCVCSRAVGNLAEMKPIHVGLVADPASPTEIARRIGDLDPPDGEGRGGWDVEVVSEPFTIGCEDIDTALARLGDQARQHHWDLVVGLTELPLRDDERPVTCWSRPTRSDGRRCCRCPHWVGFVCNAHPPCGARSRQRHGRPHLAGRAPRATAPTQRPLAAALGHGARQPSVASRARAQVRARRGPGNRSRRHHQLHRLATGWFPVVVASRGRDDRVRRARRRLARDRWRTVGPPRRQLHPRLGRGPVSTTPRRW